MNDPSSMLPANASGNLFAFSIIITYYDKEPYAEKKSVFFPLKLSILQRRAVVVAADKIVLCTSVL